MIKHVKGRDACRSLTVKIRPNPGASTYDLMDYVVPAARKEPKTQLNYANTNQTQPSVP